jgi:hypothetical protein
LFTNKRTGVFPQDFVNMTHAHGIGNFSDVLLKIEKNLKFAMIK